MLKIPRRVLKWIRHPATLVTVAQLAFRVGKDVHKVHRGQINGAEFRARAGDHVGALSGGLAGAWMGASAGTFLAPGVGTAVGALIGGLMGETMGGKAARVAVERTEARLRNQGTKEEKEEEAENKRGEANPHAPPTRRL